MASPVAAKLVGPAARDLADFDGWSMIPFHVQRPFQYLSSARQRGSRLVCHVPFTASQLSLGYENADASNAAPAIRNTNAIKWKASVEPLGAPIATATGAAVAPSATATKLPVMFGGKRWGIFAPSEFGLTDPIRGKFLPGTAIFIHSTAAVSGLAAPAAPAVAAAAGTSIAVGTYQVGIAIVYPDGAESPCSPATAVTLTAGNQAISVTSPTAATYPGASGWKPYVGVAGGSSAGPLYDVGVVEQPFGTNLTVSLLPSSSAVSVLRQANPNGSLYLPVGGYAGGGTGSGASNSGEYLVTLDYTDQGFGPSANLNQSSTVGPFCVMAKDPTGKVHFSACVGGDSINAGTGDCFEFSGIGGGIQRALRGHSTTRVWNPVVAMPYGYQVTAIPGQTIGHVIGVNGRVSVQKAFLNTHYYSNLGTNDLSVNGAYAAGMVRDKVAEALLFTPFGHKVRFSTLTPRTTSTDGWRTIANQTIPELSAGYNIEGGRRQFNNVLRSAAASAAIVGEALWRSQATILPATNVFSGGDATSTKFLSAYLFQTGTEVVKVAGVTKAVTSDYTYLATATINGVQYASGITFGAAPTNGATVTMDYTRCAGLLALIAEAETALGIAPTGATAIIDAAAQVEVNAANASTVGGSWWAEPAAAIATISGVSATTTSTLTTSGLTQDQYRGYALVVTADPVTPAAVGQVSAITGNTVTVVSFTTMATQPSTSATFSVARVLATDGIHPAPDGAMAIAPAYAAQIAVDAA